MGVGGILKLPPPSQSEKKNSQEKLKNPLMIKKE